MIRRSGICLKTATSLLVLVAVFFNPLKIAHADSTISIIIDDIGYEYKNGIRALELHPDITFAILPNTPFTDRLVNHGLKLNREFILHLPMQSIDNRLFTADALHIHMTPEQLSDVMARHIQRFPYIKGINNHMGSLLTIHPGFMDLFTTELNNKYPHLFFIDSKTIASSIAYLSAQKNNVPSMQRDLFLDSTADTILINRQFDQLLKLSKQRGHALAICHPYPETLSVLKARIPQLKRNGVKLVPASSMIQSISENKNEKDSGTTSAGL